MSNVALRTCAAGLLCIALSIAGRASAQGAESGPVPGEIVARYLQQDLLVKPGSGFQRVHIGQNFDEVAAR